MTNKKQDLPQRTLASKMQALLFEFQNRIVDQSTASQLIDVEKYFKNLLRKVEQYYCRRLQKIQYLLTNQKYEEALQKIRRYHQQKPWKMEPDQQQPSNFNCNQVLSIQDKISSSGTSTPFSHYSNIPSFKELHESLDQAICIDSSFDVSLEENQQVDAIQQQLQNIQQSSPNGNHAKLDDLIADDQEEMLCDFNISEINNNNNNAMEKSFSNLLMSQEILDDEIPAQEQEFNFQQLTQPSNQKKQPFQNKQQHSLQQEQQQQQLSQQKEQQYQVALLTQQSTKEIIKYVEQYQREQRRNLTQPKSTQSPIKKAQKELLYSPLAKQLYKRYRVKSSYTKVINQTTTKKQMRSNFSYDNFDQPIKYLHNDSPPNKQRVQTKQNNKNQPQLKQISQSTDRQQTTITNKNIYQIGQQLLQSHYQNKQNKIQPKKLIINI